MEQRFEPQALLMFASNVLQAAGMPLEMAEVTAKGLLEADLYGHSTHGLALLGEYVEEIEARHMVLDGTPEVLSEQGAVACWDARRLPGVWTTTRAIEDAVKRADAHGIGAVAVRRSHHIACLASFLEAPARDGYLVMVFSSDPSDTHVAPFGGSTPVMTPNPIAAGIPRDGDPILIDISMSITTAGMCARLRAEGKKMPEKWLLDAAGTATDDPHALTQGGSILPIGGLDHGHKGFGLCLLVEALTQGLSGYGRAEAPQEWGASILVLALAPGAFGAPEDFLRQVNWLTDACLNADPIDDANPVRLPGQAALHRKASALRDGLALYPSVTESLNALSARLGTPLPAATTI